MASASGPIVFIVPGVPVAADVAGRAAPAAQRSTVLPRGRIKASVRIGARRGADGQTRMTAIPGEDVVVVHIANGPSLVLHPETARDLMLAQSDRRRESGRAGTRAPSLPDEVGVPARLQWRGLEQAVASRGAARGGLGDALITGIDIVTGLGRDDAADLAASAVARKVDAQVDAGVYALRAEKLKPLKGSGAKLSEVPAVAGPMLVLIHGTFSTTTSSFGNLWTQHPQRVRALFDHYDGRVYALDHPTLGVSPIANALTLAQAMPQGARLHLMTHSRGGLVAEVLARVCAGPDRIKADLARFAGTRDADDLAALAALVKKRSIAVERVVRVACPARGTLLASRRLDAYVSVFKWTLELAGVPVAPELVDFLGEVAQRRQDKNVLPGLEAQVPNSALVQWLHAVDDPIDGELRVIAGDIEGDSVASWVKTLMADAFYRTENDLVVDTRSMYGGSPRAGGATFVLDEGGKVSHFAYFSNERTAQAIVDALVHDAPSGFRTIGPLSWAGKSPTGKRAARGDERAASDKPAVFVLPGILGSNLKVDGKRIWLSFRIVNGLRRLAYKAGKPDGVEPDRPIENVYDDLMAFLDATHEVIEFAFDWRRPMEEEARRLAVAVDAALAARKASGQPVRLLVHSMGGLVARTMQLEAPEVWDRMMARTGARVLMLGTPNGGSWAPMQVLSGDDSFGNMLSSLGAPFADRAAKQLMAEMPGFLQLQYGLLDTTLGLDSEQTWRKLADDDLRLVREFSYWHHDELQAAPYEWGVPTQTVLDRAIALRKRLDAQVADRLPAFADKLLLVVGKAKFTPDGFEVGPDGLFYLDAPEAGDGRVTRASAMLPGVRTWHIDCEHGDLPKAKFAFDGYLELLDRGDTARLERVEVAAPSRGAPAPAVHVKSRPAREALKSTPPQTEADVYAPATSGVRAAPTGSALRVTVVNGDVTFVREPLMIGHYRSLRLTGTESVVDRLLDKRMEASLRAGLYADAPGTHEIFVNMRRDPTNPWRMPRPEAVIVVGLGDEGKLAASDLVLSVRQAAIEWSRRLMEADDVPLQFELAATLIGSGGTRMSAGQAAQLVAQGVWEANQRIGEENERLQRANGAGERDAQTYWPMVTRLRLIELYLDRATDAWRALQVQALASPNRYLVDDVVQSGIGALRRPPDASYRGADYDFITAETRYDIDGAPEIAYTLDTRRARSELRAQAAQGALLKALVLGAANADNRDARVARTLFNLLVPLELEPFLGGTTDMVIELDRGTAGIPWELLDTDAGTREGSDRRPWAIRTKLLRKLRTDRFRAQVADAGPDAHVLVIGEPKCNAELYPPLPGAFAEAVAVAKRLSAADGLPANRITRLIGREGVDNSGADAATIVGALLERDWRIVHIAGHGAPPELVGDEPRRASDPPQRIGNPRGVVLSGDVFLGPREIEKMRIVPELVFVNCCHLAAPDRRQLLAVYDRPRFAATVAEELIKIGVRCVVAAGWAVDDDAASAFATTFYDQLVRGRRFIEAVANAREAAWQAGGNTWAAYQCYGDPDWVLRRGPADAQRPAPSPGDEFGGIASPAALMLALETLRVQSEFQHADDASQNRKIAYLEGRFGATWGASGEVAEAFARARARANDWTSAVAWYEKALEANDASATIKAAEDLANVRVRLAEATVNDARARLDALRKARAKSRPAARGKATKKPEATDRALAAARAGLRRAIDGARRSIVDAIAQLETLLRIQPTMERESLCASAYKRLALIEGDAGDEQARARAIAQMGSHYRSAEAIGRERKLADTFYPAMNRVAAEIVAGAGRKGRQEIGERALAAIRGELVDKARDDPDFWRIAALIELDTYEALSRRDLAEALAAIERDYDDLHNRVGAPWLWSSLYDQARFVLAPYAERASAAEKTAANALLQTLAKMAHPA